MIHCILKFSWHKRGLLIAATLALVGCHAKQADSPHGEADSQKVSLYQKGKGLLLPDEMNARFARRWRRVQARRGA